MSAARGCGVPTNKASLPGTSATASIFTAEQGNLVVQQFRRAWPACHYQVSRPADEPQAFVPSVK